MRDSKYLEEELDKAKLRLAQFLVVDESSGAQGYTKYKQLAHEVDFAYRELVREARSQEIIKQRAD